MIDQAQVNEMARAMFADAIEQGNLKTVEKLLECGIDPDDRRAPNETESNQMFWTPLMLAACDHRFDIVDVLLKAGADPLAVTISDGDTDPKTVFDLLDEHIESASKFAFPGALEAMKNFIRNHPGGKARTSKRPAVKAPGVRKVLSDLLTTADVIRYRDGLDAVDRRHNLKIYEAMKQEGITPELLNIQSHLALIIKALVVGWESEPNIRRSRSRTAGSR